MNPKTLTIEGYEDLERVGGGGFSTIYKATDSRHNRTVAIKVLDPNKLDDRIRSAFTREHKTMGRVSQHPHIVTLFDSGFASTGEPYLVMPYYPGGSCGDLVKREGPMTVAEVLQTGVEIASALEAAHRANVVHRDVKPDNIFIDQYGRRLLGDFGISAFSGIDRSAETTSALSFTPAHASPEVLTEKKPGPASDLYSLGSTLYTLLVGANPFVAKSIGSLIMKVLNEPPEPIPRTDIPSSMHQIINDLLHKDPDRRPPSAAEVARRLQQTQVEAGLRMSDVVIENEDRLPTIDLREAVDEDRTHVPESLPQIVEPTPLLHESAEPEATHSVTSPGKPLSNKSATAEAPLAPEQLRVEPQSPKRAVLAGLATAVLVAVGGYVAWTASQSPGDLNEEQVATTEFVIADDDPADQLPLPQPPQELVSQKDPDSLDVLFTWEDTDIPGTTWEVQRTDGATLELGEIEQPSIELTGLLATERPCIRVLTKYSGNLSEWSDPVCS